MLTTGQSANNACSDTGFGAVTSEPIFIEVFAHKSGPEEALELTGGQQYVMSGILQTDVTELRSTDQFVIPESLQVGHLNKERKRVVERSDKQTNLQEYIPEKD